VVTPQAVGVLELVLQRAVSCGELGASFFQDTLQPFYLPVEGGKGLVLGAEDAEDLGIALLLLLALAHTHHVAELA